jgi:hypothetical protein
MTDPRNPYTAPAPLLFKGLAVVIILGARVQGWLIDWRLVRTEERDARRERRIAAWDSLGCIDGDDDE